MLVPVWFTGPLVAWVDTAQMRVKASRHHAHDSDATEGDDPDLYGSEYKGRHVSYGETPQVRNGRVMT